MVILSTKFVDELRNVPEDELSSIKANTDVRRIACLICSSTDKVNHRTSKEFILQRRFSLKAISILESCRRN